MALKDFIPVAGPLIEKAIDIPLTERRNRKQRQFILSMYQRQIADRERFWHMQNEYNLPSNQMARLKAAGLNPNLVYGNGATTTAGDISAPSPQSYSPDAPSTSGGFSAGLAAYNATRLTDAELLVKQANARKLNAEAANTESLAPYTLQEGRARADLMTDSASLKQIENLVARDVFDRGIPVQNAIVDAAYRVLKNNKVDVDISAVKAATKHTAVKTALDNAELELRKQGTSFRDPQWQRYAGQAIQRLIMLLSVGD